MTTIDMKPTPTRDHRGIGYWLTMLLAGVITMFGVPILAGGIWLIILGGSWYYALAGVGLLATAALILAGSITAVSVYAATYLFTLIWALWEVGLNGWAQVPRLVAPTVILVLVLATIPVLRRRNGIIRLPSGRSGLVSSVLVVVFGLAGAYAVSQTTQVSAQNTAPAVAAPENSANRAAPAPLAPVDEAQSVKGDRNAPDPTPTTPTQSPVQDDLMQELRRPALAMREAGSDWPAYGGSIHAARYSPNDQINRDNIGTLKKVWQYRTGDMPSAEAEGKYSPENTPLKVGDDLYTCSAMGIAIAIDAATGREEWRYDPQVPVDAIPYGATCRGVAYFENPAADGQQSLCSARILWGTLDARLLAVDARTGQPCQDFGQNGEIYLEDGLGETVPGWYSITSAPTIVRGVAVMGAQVKDGQAEDSPSGVIRGYDAVTGELVWAWDLGNPDLRGKPEDGEVYTRGTPNMWTTAAGDEALGQVYLPLGNSAVDYYGSNRSAAENEYATSLVALDVATGEEVWHFQTVHNDVWDYDLGSQPSLIDFPLNGETVPAIVLSSKQGEIYVLNRQTGESLFPVEERSVPAGMGVEPDYLSPTQPFSAYHSLAKQDLNSADMWGMTPLDQLWCRIQFRRANYAGIYTPPTSDGHWIQYPGYNGGQDWGSMAIDVERGILIANYNDMPNYNRLVPRAEADADGVRPIFSPEGPGGEAGPQLGSPYAISVNAGWREEWTGLMCKEPPYGGIRAIDLETGETLWDQPLGQARANGPFGIPSMLPIKIGTPNNGGPLITAGGLIFIAAATDNLIRAIDIETGETVWSDVLPAGGQTTPISYEVGGRQFIALAPGGHHFMETPIGDYVIAWAVPEE